MTLEEWCKRECKHVYLWLKSEGIPVSSYYSLIRGRDVKLSTAMMIHDATKGEVAFADLLSPKARKALENRKKKKS